MIHAGMIDMVRVSADEFYVLQDDARTALGIYNSAYYERTYLAEHKYGTPVPDLTLTQASPVEDAVKACLVSMDSTLRKNLSVGLLVVLLVYSWDTLKVDVHHRSDENDSYFINLKARWSQGLRDAYQSIEPPNWLKDI